MALFQLTAPAPNPDGSGDDVFVIQVGTTVMFRIDAQGQCWANGGIVSEGVAVNGYLNLLATHVEPVVSPVPGSALEYKDDADGQVKIMNDDGMIYTLTATHAPTSKPAPADPA